MNQQLQQISEQQKESWDKFSPGWKKWDTLFMEFLKPMGDEIIRAIQPKGKEVVLDVAAGTGEPGLTIASMLDGGKVIITDLSEGMLAIANENASKRGIKNVETRVADVCNLPFDDNTFDAISCRFGYMFFPDVQLATKEMLRVLKPGGRIATSVWAAPEKNFWITAIMGSINKNLQPPPPPAGAPGMFRCAKEGMLADIFSHAGFKNVSHKEITSKLDCKTAEGYWDVMNDVAAPVVAALSKADANMYAQIKSEVFVAVTQKYPSYVSIDAAAHIVYGEK